MTGIYLGLGSNTGDREKNLMRCLELLNSNREIRIIQISSIYEAEPFGYKQQPNFFNMVVEIATDLKPFKLLEITQDIERKIGRKKTFVWGPRIIDIDILSYLNLLIKHPDLHIPHQQLHLRRFALIPLKEVADRYFHPKLNKTIDHLLVECNDETRVRLIKQRDGIIFNNL